MNVQSVETRRVDSRTARGSEEPRRPSRGRRSLHGHLDVVASARTVPTGGGGAPVAGPPRRRRPDPRGRRGGVARRAYGPRRDRAPTGAGEWSTNHCRRRRVLGDDERGLAAESRRAGTRASRTGRPRGDGDEGRRRRRAPPAGARPAAERPDGVPVDSVASSYVSRFRIPDRPYLPGTGSERPPRCERAAVYTRSTVPHISTAARARGRAPRAGSLRSAAWSCACSARSRSSGPTGPIAIDGRLERALLAYLVARLGRSVPADELVEALWGSEASRGTGGLAERPGSRGCGVRSAATGWSGTAAGTGSRWTPSRSTRSGPSASSRRRSGCRRRPRSIATRRPSASSAPSRTPTSATPTGRSPRSAAWRRSTCARATAGCRHCSTSAATPRRCPRSSVRWSTSRSANDPSRC